MRVLSELSSSGGGAPLGGVEEDYFDYLYNEIVWIGPPSRHGVTPPPAGDRQALVVARFWGSYRLLVDW